MGMQYVGEIRVFPFGFAPREWEPCNGQLLPISQFNALYAVIGTRFGGDGKTSFALPDLRGRVPVCFGQAPGGARYEIGEQGGEQAVVLTEQTVPPHRHTMLAYEGRGQNENTPAHGVSIADSQGQFAYSPDSTGLKAFDQRALLPAASPDTAHGNIMPTLVMELCIAWSGLYPNRE